jgi:dihydroorotate dehydrogenase
MWLWQSLARPVLFSFDPEWVHESSMGMFALGSVGPMRSLEQALLTVDDPRLVQEVAGLQVARPLGLAAGFDKNARWVPALAALGFGSVEVGTVTAHAQPGNERPRLFRLPEDRAILNRLGFNNEGCEAVARRLARTARPCTLGINIGKSKVTPNEEAIADYLQSLETLIPWADYLTVNVSSPNTAGLRDLQERETLTALLRALQQANEGWARQHGRTPRPLFVKLAPDMDDAQLDALVEVVEAVGIAGIVATNTTVRREGLLTNAARVEALGAGGVSGAPLTQRSRRFVARIHQRSEGRWPILGVGGIMNAEDAWQMIQAGATLLQGYTGFIYGGPTWARDIHLGLLRHLNQEGGRLADHVGSRAAQLAV